MKKQIITAIIAVVGLSAFGQANTNFTAQLNTVFTNLAPAVQASTLATWADYTRAVNRSPEFKGVTTNVTETVTEGVTNIVTTITTNHPAMTFVQYFHGVLANEKIGRIVEQQNQNMRAEMYHKVGQTVVQGWP